LLVLIAVHRWFAVLVIALVSAPAGAGPVSAAPAAFRPLRIGEIFAREPLVGRTPASITWAPDGSRFLYTLPGGESGPLDTHVFDVRARRDRVFFRAAAEGKGARPAPEFVWSPDSRRVAFLDAGDLWVSAADGGGRKRLAAAADDPQWSPDSTHIAFVHAADVYAISFRGGPPARYSFDGSNDTVNGDPDWVYSEELDMHHAFCWSPDGRQIAYLRFDERPIAPFPIVDFLNPRNTVEQQRFPLAGQANSIVTLRVASPGGTSRDVYATKANDDYLASVGWMPDGRVMAGILDRSQRRLRYVAFARRSSVALVSEHDEKWVDFHGPPWCLKDKRRLLFVSDRDGQSALYLADTQAGTVRRLTRGFAVGALAGVDERLHVAFVQAAFPTRRDSTVLVIPLGGGIPRPLASGSGTHTFFLAPNARAFVRADSAFGVPPVFTIGSTLGGGLIPFTRGRLPTGRDFGGSELMRIGSPFGKLDAWMIRPPNFDARMQYPTVMYVYGGPADPTTRDEWGGTTYLFHEALAQRGFIVFSVDGPGSQIDSSAAVRRLYRKLGPASLAGQLAGVAYLQSLPYVDPERIGIWGWSFGGYETTYGLTHAPGTWKVGIAVAPLTDWRYYDTVYTERYMGTPRQNPAAYRESSAVAAGAAFEGRLLILHGTGDDNVHLANSIAFLQALVLSGKQADFIVYPRQAHGITGIRQRRHLFSAMLNYWREHL
jgi:dipeptidyl-peptidase-4